MPRNECGVPFGGNRKALKPDRGDGYTTLNVLNTTELYTFKRLKRLSLCYVHFTTIKNAAFGDSLLI